MGFSVLCRWSERPWFAMVIVIVSAVLAGCVPIPALVEASGSSLVATPTPSRVSLVMPGKIPTVQAADKNPEGQPTPVDWIELLKNLTYMSVFTQSGMAPLVDGRYEETVAPASASKILVTLTDYIVLSDLTGYGTPGALVVLATDSGGSGVFMDLAAVVLQEGVPVNLATTLLGDRVRINSLSVQDAKIIVDMITQGPTDPMCCPTQHVIEVCQLQGDQLVRMSSRVVE
jgi:hypothetical protein